MKRSFWPAQETAVTIPKEIEGVEIVGRRREDGVPKEPRIEVRGEDPTPAVVYEGEHAPTKADELISDDERGTAYYVVYGGGSR